MSPAVLRASRLSSTVSRAVSAASLGSLVAGGLLVAACSPPAPAPGGTSASAPPTARDLVASPTSASTSATATAVPAPAVAASSAAPIASAPPATSAATAAPEGDSPPRGKVSNIGMHIGGGPYDDITKEPIRKSVQPHFEAFRRCYGKAKEAKPADFGIDLRIPREGGKAKQSNARSTLKDRPFQECVEKVFEGIEFLKPRGGETVVSYSLRFTP